MGFPRQEYWSVLPFPSPGDLPHPGTEPVSPALAGRFFTLASPGKPNSYTLGMILFGSLVVKNLSANGRDLGSIPGWGRSPGEGNGNPLQYSLPLSYQTISYLAYNYLASQVTLV